MLVKRKKYQSIQTVIHMTKLAKGPNAPIQDFFKTEIVGKIKIDLAKTVI